MTNTTTTTKVTKRFKKEFSELTPNGQKARLNKYEKERAEKGLLQGLFAIIKEPTIVKAKNDKMAYIRVKEIQQDKDATPKYRNVSVFIKEDSKDFESYIKSLKPGNMVSIEYKEVLDDDNNVKYTNVWNIMRRDQATAK